MVAAVLVAVASATIGQTTNLTHLDTYTDGLTTPGRLAATSGGDLYVTDQASGEVLEFDAAGILVDTFAVPEGPVGIAVHPDGRVFVSRADGQIGVYDAAFLELALVNPAPMTMTAPNDLAYDATAGQLYAVDSGGHKVLVFAESAPGVNDWAAVGGWGVEGWGLSEFETPQSIAVDEALGRVIVTDTDNYRVQVFDTTGMLLFKFGYRTLYFLGTETAWFARAGGLAVDVCGNIYVSDALMGTVRAFDSSGVELDPGHATLLAFGTGAGQLRTPMDLMTAGGQLYVASANNGAVELYSVSCSVPPPVPPSTPGATSPLLTEDSSRKIRAAKLSKTPDDPTDIARAINESTYSVRLDLNRDRTVDVTDLTIAVEQFGAGTVDFFLTAASAVRSNGTTYEAPHVIGLTFACGRCHDMDGLPAGGMLAVEGQANLCQSCHTSSGVASGAIVPNHESGLIHPVGVAADQGSSHGPDPGSVTEVALHLDEGSIRCGTCHNPHNSIGGEPFLRASTGRARLCGECHTEADEWLHAGHADETAEAFMHYDWAEPGRASCRRCHSGNGYIGFSEGLAAADQDGSFRVLDCLTCHATHGKPQSEELLRTYGDVELPTVGPDVTVTGKGAMATCMACHNGRRAPDDGSLTPHYLLGGVMLEGINGNDFGHTLMSSQHTHIGATCMDCHMAPGPAEGQPGHGKVGGHTFNVSVHDPEDLDYGYQNLTGCNAAECHGNTGPLTTTNRMAYGDYDGDGTVEGVQDEVQGLLDLVLAEIEAKGAVKLSGYPYWDLSGVVDVPAGNLQLVRDAIWNWQFVINSGDNGVKNTAYTVGLLQVTFLELTGSNVPDAELRFIDKNVTETVVNVTSVNGGAPVEPGGAFTVDFTVEDEFGNPIDMADLNRLRLYVSGPATNYQIVIPSDSDLTHFAQNGDGSYTYTAVDPFPTVYSAPLNDSGDITEGELTGQALLDGTYTVLIESRQVFGSLRKAGDATMDFVVTSTPATPPALASREFVTRDVCNNCHNDLQLHGSNRYAVTGCVICHTTGGEDLVTAPGTTPGVTIQFGDMIHKIHRGHALRKVEATANSADPYRYEIIGHGESVNDFSDIGFPMIPKGITDCDACHGGAAQGGDIFAAPTRAKCGGCHDDLDFATGTVLDQTNPSVQDGLLTEADLSDPAYRVFPNGQDHTAATDNFCAGCHAPGGFVDAELAHQHPTDPAVEGTRPVLEIVSVGGMTGGGGTYFVAGDYPEITFRVTDDNGLVELVPGDGSTMDRIAFAIAGPTTLYQTIIERETPWSSSNLAVPPANWVDNFGIDGTYTYISVVPFPADYPAQLNSLGEAPAEQIFPYADGWGQQYTAGGTPLDAGTYTVLGWGRRVTPTDGEREPALSDQFDVPFGSDDPLVPYGGTVTTAKCNACHGVLAFHGNQREGVNTCMACHTAGTQDGGTYETVDLRVMVHKLHNARNLMNLPYEMNGHGGIADFSDLLISAMPGEAAECQVCHVNDDWKNPPVRANMRTWMTACTSCHDGAGTAAHADAMIVPGTFIELCSFCHGDGGAVSVESVHASP